MGRPAIEKPEDLGTAELLRRAAAARRAAAETVRQSVVILRHVADVREQWWPGDWLWRHGVTRPDQPGRIDGYVGRTFEQLVSEFGEPAVDHGSPDPTGNARPPSDLRHLHFPIGDRGHLYAALRLEHGAWACFAARWMPRTRPARA